MSGDHPTHRPFGLSDVEAPARPGAHTLRRRSGRTEDDAWDDGRDEDAATFAAVAVRLAGLAGAVFGWRPGEFWDATPDELAALLAAIVPEAAAPPDAGMIARLREAYPDG